MNNNASKSIAIIGAGIAGLSCAIRLKSLGHHVELFEKGRGPAGRMSTKRGDDWTADHGAQYFTARDPLFINQVEQWLTDGVAAVWRPLLKVFEANQWTISPSKDIRYVGIPGMNGPAKQLAKDVTIHSSQTINGLTYRDGRWYLRSAEAGDITQSFDEIVLAIPGPQVSALAQHIHPDIKALTEASNMKGCWTIMARFKEKQNVPFDAAFINKEIVSWIARNLSKPSRKGLESWTIHANADWSQEFIELNKEQVAEQILACAKKLGLDCANADVSIHRWRYASGATASGIGSYVNPTLHIGLCGDWLNGGRVEGAWLSGHHLANRISQ